jgi:D-glycero-D-manno-heptose 1,7-bisphosphate phosphatase
MLARFMRAAVFLDRDDTIIDTQGVTADSSRPGDLWRPELVRLMPGAAGALRALHEAGLALVVFTSQGGVARGGYGLPEVEAVNDRMRDLLLEHSGLRLDGLYYCPYHPTGSVAPFNIEHDWRKPAPGMIRTASRELGIDVSASFAVGDKPRDVEAAVNGGLARDRCFLLATSGESPADCADLPAAARLILRRAR